MPGLDETIAILREAAGRSDAVLVAYSDGKDSRAVLDLCVRTFKRVEAFFMYLVPGLECVETGLDWARKKYGITIRQYPHWLLRRFLTEGTFCNAWYKNDQLPEWKLRDVYNLAMAEARCGLVATGAKRADSRWRKWNLANVGGYTDVIYPIVGWSKLDVLSYLKAQSIAPPPSSGRSATGIDLSVPSVTWLAQTYPDDFKRLCEVFPYAEAIVWREKFYGGA